MTIGEKIKYFRARVGITQGRLAELSDIHPVSIRKYETNKMVPAQPQIDRLAKALGVSSFALTGTESNISQKTVGDFMGLFFFLYKAKLLVLEGDRGEDGALVAETVRCKPSPFLCQFFTAALGSTEGQASEVLYRLNSPSMLRDIIRWEKVSRGYERMIEEYGESEDENIRQVLEEMGQDIERIEMEFQRSSLVSGQGSLGVMINPDYFGKG